MRVKFENCCMMEEGIALLKQEINIESCETGEEFRIIYRESCEDILNVNLSDGIAVIECKEKARFFRGLALALLAYTENKTIFSIQEKPNFITHGPMFDVSRNSVLRVSTVKRILNKCALMGLNMFMLYTEDTYEVKEYSYFGHMRGRYSAEEIKEMDDYAYKLGIELIPCIQCLSHLGTALQWDFTSKIKDVYDTLLIGADDTYEFIDTLLKNISRMFRSRRVHLGLDEAFFVGCGEYVERNQKYIPKIELMLEHVNRVNELCQKYGLQPMMYSDTLFSASRSLTSANTSDGTSELVKKGVPKEMQQVAWSYDLGSEEAYIRLIKNHDGLCDNLAYCGAIFTFMGFFPDYQQTILNVCGLGACIKCGIKDVIISVWNNESECSLITSLYGLQLYADYDYRGYCDETETRKIFEFICGVRAEDIINLEKIDDPAKQGNPSNSSRFLMFNDPIVGLLDKHVENVDTRAFYAEMKEMAKLRKSCDEFFTPVFTLADAVIDVLELKADLGVRVKKAYEEKNVNGMKKLYEEITDLEERFYKLKRAHMENWYYYNKSFGFEIHDMYYGTMVARLETLKIQLDKWFIDTDYTIEEMEEERLYLWTPKAGEHPVSKNSFYRFGRFFTPNVYAIRYRAHLFG